MEVIEIQCYSVLKAKFREVGPLEFYKYMPTRFESTRKLAYKIVFVFGSTYRCEQLFSLMKGNKPPVGSTRISDIHPWISFGINHCGQDSPPSRKDGSFRK
ncbi:hypothetical protein AVEN_55782-1 [Araneus ventricosus]|uniref:HAT C-terminal dimerisation domain-containing protein n=1 Tax=Araneus ventricosus TaxID=182803 RepID=A0A4Y2EY64_ARAVE|nr:hypothetical protein AVEN_55782-1 [Araneus ventricosus]